MEKKRERIESFFLFPLTKLVSGSTDLSLPLNSWLNQKPRVLLTPELQLFLALDLVGYLKLTGIFSFRLPQKILIM